MSISGPPWNLGQQPAVPSFEALQAAIDALNSSVSGKASQSSVDGLSTALAARALQTAVDAISAAMSGKAAQTAVDTLTNAVSGKASQSAFDSLAGTVAALPPSRFLPGDVPLATLLAISPTTSDGMYAKVPDMWGDVASGMQSGYAVAEAGTWRPVRPFAVRRMASFNADMTLAAFANAPTQILSGTLTASRNISLSNINAWPGARFRINRSASGLFGAVVKTLVGGTTLASLAANSWADFEFDGTTWGQTASGGLI